MIQELHRRTALFKSINIFLTKNMFRQLQIIERSKMPNSVTSQGPDVVDHYVMSCVTLLKKQDIVTTNV